MISKHHAGVNRPGNVLYLGLFHLKLLFMIFPELIDFVLWESCVFSNIFEQWLHFWQIFPHGKQRNIGIVLIYIVANVCSIKFDHFGNLS